MLEKKTKIYWLFILPGCLFLAFFMLIPLFSLILKTFFPEGEGFSLANYTSLLKSTYFKQVFWRSIRLSLISTCVCAVLGFPTAYYISKYSKNKGILMLFYQFQKSLPGFLFRMETLYDAHSGKVLVNKGI